MLQKMSVLMGLMAILLVPKCLYAQELMLTETELQEFRERAATRIIDFMDYLPQVADKKKGLKKQNYYAEQTLELFVGKGKDSNMETSKILPNNTAQIETFKMPVYLQKLIKNGYSNVKIQFAETFYVSNFYPTGKNQYKATATIFQKFTGYGAEGRPLYEDVTKKTFEIVVEKVIDIHGERWVVLLNDISVAETYKP